MDSGGWNGGGDHPDRTVGGGPAAEGGADAGCEGGASDAGDRAGAGGPPAGRGGAGPGRARRLGALAPHRPARPHRTALRAAAARAHGGKAAAPAALPAPVRAPAAPRERPGGARGVQKNFAALAKAALPPAAQGKPIEVWFQDEARVGQQGTITRVWARRGSRPRAPRDRRHTWAWLFSGAHAVVLCDGAGWHQQGGRLVVPDNLTLLPLPPYAPELNAMENVWEYLRGNRLSHKVWDAYDAILDACCDAWNSLAEEPQRLTSITNRSWAKAVIE